MNITRLEQVPDSLNAIFEKMCALEAMLISPVTEKPNDWMDIDELICYLPSHPAKQTIYGLVNRKAIPCSLVNGKLIFVRIEIDEWLRSKKKLTQEEIDNNAAKFISSRRKSKTT